MKKLGLWVAAMAMAAGVAWAQPVRTTQAAPSPGARPVAAASSSTNVAPDLVLDLNKATAEEFEKLPGIGPAKAKAMVDYQKSHGYRKVEDVTKIQGIGRKTLQKLRPQLTVSDRASSAGGAARASSNAGASGAK